MFRIENLKFKDILDIQKLVIDKPISCILGKSGSGKTTLLRLMNCMLEPEYGNIYYNDKPINEINPVMLRRKVVMLSQTPIIYAGTIADNLQIGRHFSQKLPLPTNRLLEVLEKVNLNKPLDSYCDKLSGGEKQRLCLGRVLLMEADTYLMDEPSSALDSENECFIINKLAEHVLTTQKQLIIVTHSEQVADMFSDCIIRIEQGRVVYNG